MNLKEICQTLSREIQKLVPYDRAAINILQRDEKFFSVYAEESRLPESAIPEGVSVREGTATSWVLDHKEPVICRDVLKDPRFPLTHKRYKNVKLRSYVILPLTVKGKVLGALNLGSLKPRCYGKKEVAILSPVAEILSLAIENSNLYEESQRLLKEQSALREIFTHINLLDLGHLLHQLTEQALTLLQVDHVQVRLLDEQGKLKTMVLAGAGAERFRDQVASSGTGRSTWVMENRQPLAIKDISQDQIHGPGRLMREMGVKGYLCVPLIARTQKSIGVLLATSLKEREFTQEEIALARQLAAGAAVAIENARLFEELQKKSQELEEAYKTKSAFLNTMAHELRTPLNVLIATMQLFTEGFYGELTEKQIKGLEPMQRNTVNLLNLIASILDLARLEARRVPVQVEEFRLKEITDELESSFVPLAKEKGIEMRLRLDEPGLTLKSDKTKIRAVLQNLVGNAVKYTDRGEIDLRIGTSAAPDDDRAGAGLLCIEVKDTGIGIKEADLPHIFEAFYMAEGVNRRKYPGSGLGLCIVKRLLQLLHGDIQVRSEWGKGSTFAATLPLIHPEDKGSIMKDEG